MAESIVVHFAHADRAAVAGFLLAAGCSPSGHHAWQYPANDVPTLWVDDYWDASTEYEPSELQALTARLGGPPQCSLVIELRRSLADRAVDDAIALSAKLLGLSDGIVDDAYSELWTLDEIHGGVVKRDGRFLDCYRAG